MHSHIKKCELIDFAKKTAYFDSNHAVAIQSHHKKPVEDKSKSIGSFFGPKIPPKSLAGLHDQAVRFALSANLFFQTLENPECLRLLKMLNPTATMPTARTLTNTVLHRLQDREEAETSAIYRDGALVSISFDGWRTPSNDKWLGF